MGRILYGIQADGTGHINRARIVASDMSHHEFLFVGGGRVREMAQEGHLVESVPFMDTIYRNNGVDAWRTAAGAAGVLFGRRSVVDRLADITKDFDPDLIITDYEYFTPLAARRLGRFCVSLDHQHILTRCIYQRPNRPIMSRLLDTSIIRTLYSNAHHYLIVSFFHHPPANPSNTDVFPSIIRKGISEHKPYDGDHVLVYQTSQTFHRLLPVLENIDSHFVIYGFGRLPSRANLSFRERSEESFAKDLASCAYVIANGGHNVISEALFLGKPVFCFPISNHYEQFTNAYFVAKLGYGAFALDADTSLSSLTLFQSRLDQFKLRIEEGDFYGNAKLVKRLEDLMACPGFS